MKLPMTTRLRMILLVVLLLIGACVLAGAALRAWGEARFEPTPESVPDTAVPNTALVTAVRERLGPEGDAPSNRFSPLEDAALSLDTRLALANAASATLDVQYYGFHHDASGLAMLDALENAASRGVAVRLLVDDIGIGTRADCFARLAARTAGLEVRVFNPTVLRGGWRLAEFVARFPRVTRRMHNKSMTADRISTIVGGRNISDIYFDADSSFGYADVDVLVSGPAATTVADAFDTYWYSGLAVDVGQLTTRKADVRCDGAREGVEPTDVSAALPTKTRFTVLSDLERWKSLDGTWREPFSADVSVDIDLPAKVLLPYSRKLVGSAAAVETLMRSATRTLRISSPYFVPGEDGMAVIRELRERGVEVIILTNSLASTDVVSVFTAYRTHREALLRIGVQLHEFLPAMAPKTDWSGLTSDDTSLHAKNIVVDDTAVFIGSVNLDPRSFFHNTEMGVVLHSDAFASEMGANWIAMLSRVAWRLSLDEHGEIRWHGWNTDGTEHILREEPYSTRGERFYAKAFSWLPVYWLL